MDICNGLLCDHSFATERRWLRVCVWFEYLRPFKMSRFYVLPTNMYSQPFVRVCFFSYIYLSLSTELVEDVQNN